MATKFDGDGRKTIEADFPPPPGTHPLKVRRSSARMAINRFLKIGYSNHSALGGMVWVIAEYCVAHKIPFTVTAVPPLEASLFTNPIGFRVTKDSP